MRTRQPRFLHAVRDAANGHYISSVAPGHGGQLFVDDITEASLFECRHDAEWLAASLTHSGRVCEVLEIPQEPGGRA